MTSDLSKTGILLLSHGSRLDQGEKVIEAYTQMYKEEFPEAIVEYGFMEMREPNIPQSINKLTNGNDLEKIIVVPVFVAHGLHTRRDIPKLLGIENDFDGEIVLADPLGIDTRLYEIIKDRVSQNL